MSIFCNPTEWYAGMPGQPIRVAHLAPAKPVTPVDRGNAAKGARQSAAIPYRIDARGGVAIMLVTSRRKRRWILPKGRVCPTMSPYASAAKEALEEAGVLGDISPIKCGDYRQTKRLTDGQTRSILVSAFPMLVCTELPEWDEMHLRARRWFTLPEAINGDTHPEIRRLLERFKATDPAASFGFEPMPPPRHV